MFDCWKETEMIQDRAAGAVMGALIGDALGLGCHWHYDIASPRRGDPDPPRAGRFSSPDSLLTPHYAALAAIDPGIHIEPAWKVSIVYGMPCAIYRQLTGAQRVKRHPTAFHRRAEKRAGIGCKTRRIGTVLRRHKIRIRFHLRCDSTVIEKTGGSWK